MKIYVLECSRYRGLYKLRGAGKDTASIHQQYSRCFGSDSSPSWLASFYIMIGIFIDCMGIDSSAMTLHRHND